MAICRLNDGNVISTVQRKIMSFAAFEGSSWQEVKTTVAAFQVQLVHKIVGGLFVG